MLKTIDHEQNQAAKCVKSKYPTTRESTVRSFWEKKNNEQVTTEKASTTLFKKMHILVTELHQQPQMFYSAEGKICPLKILKQHQCGEEASSKGLYFVSTSSNSLPKIIFPAKFSIRVHEKHYSNTEKLSNIYRKLLYHTFMRTE